MVTDKQLATAALQFLTRVTLSPQEIPTFVALSKWLEDVANPMQGLTTPPPPSYKEEIPAKFEYDDPVDEGEMTG